MLQLSGKLWLYSNMEIYYCTLWAKQKKRETPLFWVEVNFEWCKGAMLFRVFIFIFCWETMVREKNWMRTTSVAGIIFFLFWKFHSESMFHSYAQSSFSTIVRHTDKRHLKENLPFYNITDIDQYKCESAPRFLTYYYMLPFLSNKPSF